MKYLNSSFFIVFIIFFAITVHLTIFYFNFNNPYISIEQDNYIPYEKALEQNKVLSLADDARLFPGYPILILAVNPIFNYQKLSGVFISLLSTVLAIYVFWRITNNKIATFAFAFFPPVWFMQGTKIATEPITVALLLLSIFLFLKKRYFWSGIITGAAMDIRLISICLAASIAYILWRNHKIKEALIFLLGVVILFSGLFVFNFLNFGAGGIFFQFKVYPSFSHATIGFTQIISDIFRAKSWGQYRILLSGCFYLFINLLAFIVLFKNRKNFPKFSFERVFLYWMAFSLLFIFIYSPTPLLENFSRYAVVVNAPLILGLILLDGKNYFKNKK
jgi:Gpi18-like mannosyltransferase